MSNDYKKIIDELTKRNSFVRLLYEQLGYVHFEKRNLNLNSLLKIILNQRLMVHSW